ncbi:type I pantothenate kinase [Corynebacterium sp. ES2794-CONJ1]|uniref:type I pantothenate kinase n=1 Tax=unclassified Corynebacterium TaxID=2624378 RepID=UPI0021684F29|nr:MULTISPECIES: type I pantothenate kinase [unclassified Corynebacterium]MCS4489936.1 type I pantothenate kinase [Corynebacterium sp. ES2775-CONJ]MCS4491701.1 type I pantothenate kinase [Corynebacterium sp. ES2715-CONJ3]MCS4531806.1 type I pantothenate kinase [Corynebacterium sp. ES2730-CONJ]MCU9519202.1 type I pantothenate kinase [Corynebacterium sp. ES2794-CONJ1]
MSRAKIGSPYLEFDRESWRYLRKSFPQVLSEHEVEQLRGIGENLDIEEVAEVYLPISRLIHLQVAARQGLHAATHTFLGEGPEHVPFVIGIAGSVAVGKSTTARLLQVLLQRWPNHPHVDLVTTDGFLYPARELRRRGLMERKGYPETYDQRALLRFVSDVKAGKAPVHAPVYSHTLYDRVPETYHVVSRPDILIVEGLNVLQPSPNLAISDLFDFSVYVDAESGDIEQWYINRFLELRYSSFKEPDSHFRHFADLGDEEATAQARSIWQTINLPNLVENILPTRARASLVLVKGADHSVQHVRMRKV